MATGKGTSNPFMAGCRDLFNKGLTVPLEVVFTGPVDEASCVIEDVFDMDESNVEGMHVHDKFAKFFEYRGSMEKVLSATKLPKGGNSHSTYSPYHLEDKELAHAKSGAYLSLSLLSFLKEQASAKSGAIS
ncbi:hypothetical protein Tco_0154233 [Tanacetum coccineum]